MSTVLITPNDTLSKVIPKVKKGDTVVFLEGEYPGGIKFTGINELTVTLENARIKGGTGFKFTGCNELIFKGGGEIRDSSTYGIMIVDSVGLDILSAIPYGATETTPKFLLVEGSKSSGILTGNVSQVAISGIRSNKNGQHGIYLSQSGDDLVVTGCSCSENSRSGIQVNAVQPKRKKTDLRRDSISQRVYIRHNTFTDNQRGSGAAAITFASVRRSEIHDNAVIRHQGRHGIVLWDDGKKDPNFMCHDVRIFNNSIELIDGIGKAGVAIGKGCTRVTVEPDNQFYGIPKDKYVVSL